MPTVLITGINGFVAVHTAVVYLEHGWNVRGTVRSQAKADTVKTLPCFQNFTKYGQFETVLLEDLIKGDYTEALKGVDAIAHCASPWHFKGESWASYRDPAVKGTTNILEQAAKASTVKAVAVISSFAAIGDFSKPPAEQAGKVYTEKDWLPTTEEECEKLDVKENPMAPSQWYCASKKFAEIAATETKDRVNASYSLATICPPMIFGPAIHFAKATGEELGNADVSTSSLYTAMASGKDAEIPPTDFPLYADVRNVATALYESVAQKKTGRYALCSGVFDYQILANLAKEQFPDLAKKGLVPVGKPDEKPSEKGTFKLNQSKAEKELNLKEISIQTLVKDVMEQIVALGAVKA